MMIATALIEATAKISRRFKTWLSNQGHFFFSWGSKNSNKTNKLKQSLHKLPDEISKQLRDAVQNLPSNLADVEAISTKLEESFAHWRKDPDHGSNSIVILSSPVAAISRILSEALADWAEEKQVSIKILSLKTRPSNTETIKSQLEDFLKNDAGQTEIVIIPNLCWCFLRSIEGLQGIEYLQSLLCSHLEATRFWILGANHVGWDYLNLVFNLEAYCGEVITLPEIESKQLQSWLEPIIDQFEIIFDELDIDRQLLDQEKDDKTFYFERLTAISNKVSIVATQIFLQSICYQELDEEKSESNQKVLVARNPQLPDLPILKAADQYLLYSLLLHDDLTISALAESLGDDEAEVQGIVQMLSRHGVIEQQHRTLRINPIHYPRLKKQLQSNNFIINRG